MLRSTVVTKITSVGPRKCVIPVVAPTRRHVHVSRASRAVAAPAQVSSAAPNNKAKQKPSKRETTQAEGLQWLEGAGKQYDIVAPRRWLHPERPFPKNPWFVPPVPVGDATREEIYQTYRAAPQEWTPRKLAEKFQLSVLRVEAILRLKHLEKRQVEQGLVLQTGFRKGIESMLGVGTTDPKCALREPVDAFRPIPRTPETARLVTEDDPELEAVARHAAANSEFNRADGSALAEEEKVVEQRALGFERRADGNYVMPLSGVIAEPEPEPTVLEAVNPRETSKRWRFLIADVSIHGESKSNGKASSATEKPVLVRDQDGTLRTATRAERKMHTRLFPAAKSVQRLPNQAARNLWEV